MTEQVATDRSDSPEDPLALKLQERFGDAIGAIDAAADHPTVVVPPDQLLNVLSFLRDDPDLAYDRLVDICGVDYLGMNQAPRFGVIYHVYSMARQRWLRLRVLLDASDPVVPSIVGQWPAANFMEREAYDMYGIRFSGHPDLKRILTPDEWDAHPLRKDFSPPPEPIEFSFNPEQWQKAVQRGGS